MNVRVSVLLHANFREIVGKREIVEEINSNPTLEHILDKLAKKYGKDFRQIVDPEKGIVSLEFLHACHKWANRKGYARVN